MITLKDFIEAIEYRITDGAEYQWECYGKNAYILDSWSDIDREHSISVVFDRVTQEVYQAEAHDYKTSRSYRLINAEYADALAAEASVRKCDITVAYDNVKFVDLDVDADFLEKAKAIVQGREYDTRVQVELDLEDEILNALFRIAHSQDITFNQLIEQIIEQEINRRKNDTN